MFKRLTSIRLAITLIVIIIILCAIATLLPQNQVADYYSHYYGEIFAKIITTLSLDHVYTSVWMYGAGLLFGINLICCTIQRTRWAINSCRGQFRPHVFGSPMLHLGLCLILLGVSISLIFGQNNYYEIPVGKTQAIKEGKVPFNLLVKDFAIDYYDDGQTPKQYRSLLEADDGTNIESLEAAVNAPASFRGVKMYQNAYGWMVNVTIDDGQATKTFDLKEQQWVTIHEASQLAMAVRFYPDYKIDETGRQINQSAQPNNPRLMCMLTQGDTPIGAEVLSVAQTIPLVGELSLTFDGYGYYTGLQIKYDWGIPIIFIGFILITVGLVIRFALKDTKTATKVGEERDNNGGES